MRTLLDSAFALALCLGAITPLAAQTDAGRDFVPGDRVLYQSNFGAVTLGMFPRTLRLMEGNAEVARVDGQTLLRVTGQPTTVAIPLPTMLPERFTLEMQLNGLEWEQAIWFVPPESSDFDYVTLTSGDAGIKNNSREFTSIPGIDSTTQWITVRVMADGNYTKVYVDDRRVANVPTAQIGRSNTVYLALYASPTNPVLVRDLRIAAGGKDLYRALMDDGRMTLDGLEFDTGSATLRPISDNTLTRVAAVLRARPALAVEIEGHTDNAGSDDANLALSQRRADSVRNRLMALGVAGTQLTAKGFGSERPIASNDTPEGRQRNRRVELVRPE